MTKSVRYQDGQLYIHHGAWFVRYRVRVRQEDGSIRLKQKAKKLGSIVEYPLESQIMPLKTEFMHRLNASTFTPQSSMVLKEFVDKIYLPSIEELRGHEKGISGNLEQSHA